MQVDSYLAFRSVRPKVSASPVEDDLNFVGGSKSMSQALWSMAYLPDTIRSQARPWLFVCTNDQ